MFGEGWQNKLNRKNRDERFFFLLLLYFRFGGQWFMHAKKLVYTGLVRLKRKKALIAVGLQKRTLNLRGRGDQVQGSSDTFTLR